ncbi:MAG: tetratricopeptide repeat protein [Cyclobacteriaceae bacterium]|nr:tetratricopeptide repeat protein [Cyclobacteriaceae bacterium]
MVKTHLFLVLSLTMLMAACGEARRDQKKMHFLHKGNLSFKEKLYFDAVRYYREAIQLDSSFAQAYNNLGIVYFKTERAEEAVRAYDAALALDPQFYDAYYNRSNANYALGNFAQVIADLNKIKEKSWPEASLLFAKGMAFFGMKDYDSAQFAFSKALQLDSANSEAYINLATVLLYRKAYDQARTLARLGLDKAPDYPEAYNVLGMVEAARGHYQMAIDLYDLGLSIEHNNAYLLNNRGYAFLQLQQYDPALRDINESIVIDPQNAWAYQNKGIYYYKKQNILDAERLLRQATSMDSSLALSWYYLGKLLPENGEKTLACNALEQSMLLGDTLAGEAFNIHCQ